MRVFIVFILSFISYLPFIAQNYIIDFKVKNYSNDTAYIGTLYGTKQLTVDTLIKKDDNLFLWDTQKGHPPGIYFLWLKAEKTFIQFLLNGVDTRFSLELDMNRSENVVIKNSIENQIFHEYLKFLGTHQTLQDSLQKRINLAKENGQDYQALELEKESARLKVDQYKLKISNENMGALISFLLKGSLEPEVPDFSELDEKERQDKRYYYFRDHYFDNIDFAHPALLRSSFVYPKVNDYIHKISYLHPDSMKVSIDVVMNKLKVNPEAHKYFLAELLNNYAQLTIAGQDALYVHLVDTYFNKGEAPWIGQAALAKINSFADKLRPSLLGNIMVDFTTYLEDGSPIRLHEIEAEYTVLFFWDPTCAHCKKVFPKVKEFHEKYNKPGYVQVVTICSKGGERYPKCWDYLKEMEYNQLLNTGDEFQRYNEIHKFNKFPKAIILDKNKKVLMKDFNPDKLENVFNNLIKNDLN